MIGYKVGEEFFYNKYLALYNSFKNNKPLRFLCNDEQYDLLDWGTEPKESLEELMTAHALNLRHTHDRVILGWSGGSDSHTIYKVLQKNKIYIDEIIIKTSKDLIYQPKNHADWIRKNHYDKNTIITEYDQYDDSFRLLDRPNEEWIWKNCGDVCHAGVNTGGAHTKFQIEKNHGGKKYVFITGYEKPQLKFSNGTWWASIGDRTIYHVIGHNYNIEYFYLQPLIHLKQCHLYKNYLKKYIVDTKKSIQNDTSAWNILDGDYNKIIQALHRTELTHGVSSCQKLAWKDQLSIDLGAQNTYRYIREHHDHILTKTLSNDNKASINFFRGLFNLYCEKKFVDYLNANHVQRAKNHLLDLKHIYSKWYNLGP